MVSCMVIDDDQDIVDIFSDLLNVLNVDILATDNSGKNALKLYEQVKPDLVFTDLQMPRYDGVYVVETIKDVFPNAKIVVITGELNIENRNLLSLLNVPVIQKPFDVHEIKQVLTDVFLDETGLPSPFEIQYSFEDDLNVYSCTVTYEQYRNFKKLPIISECTVVNTEKNLESYQDEMQKALDLAVQNDTSHIRKLSEVVRS